MQYSESAKHRYIPFLLEGSPFACSTPQDVANRIPPPAPSAPAHQLEIGSFLMGAARFGNNSRHLVNLCLCAAEGTELRDKTVSTQNAGPREGEKRSQLLTLFFANFRARLSLLLRRSSTTRRSYGARLERIVKKNSCGQRGRTPGITNPVTSLTMSRTKAVRLLRRPLVRLTRALTGRGVDRGAVGFVTPIFCR